MNYRAIRASVALFLLAMIVPFRLSGQSVTKQDRAQSFVAVKLPLTQAANGVDGYLELLNDARLTPKLRDQGWETGEFEGAIDVDSEPKMAPFKSEPPRNAELQIVGREGRVIESKALERPLAKLSAVQLYGDSRLTYLLTVDYSAGFGSYSGPITDLLEVSGGHMRWVEATDAKTGSKGQISLMSSLKTAWKLVEASDGKGQQILLAQCRPDWKTKLNEDQNFTTIYARFYFDGAKWVVVKRTVKGISEFDDGFPSRKLFP